MGLAAAIAAAAALADELIRCAEAKPASVQLWETWTDQRAALTVFMWPSDVARLAEALRSAHSSDGPAESAELATRIHTLHKLFWCEQQLFIVISFLRVIPPARQLCGYRPVPVRIHEKLTEDPPEPLVSRQ